MSKAESLGVRLELSPDEAVALHMALGSMSEATHQEIGLRQEQSAMLSAIFVSLHGCVGEVECTRWFSCVSCC